MARRKPQVVAPAEPQPAPTPAPVEDQQMQQIMQVNPDLVMRRIAMLILAMSSFHPMELELTAQTLRQNETRAKLSPEIPVEITQTIGYNARLTAAVASFQKHLAELEADALRAQQESTVLRGPIVFPGGRPS